MKNLKITMLLALSLAAAVPAIPVSASSNTVTAYADRYRTSRRAMEDAARTVQKAFEKKDLDSLAKIINFPLDIALADGELVTLDNKKALTDFGYERIFTKGLCEAIASTNLSKLEEVGDSGVQMGGDNGLSLYRFKGKWKVNGIYTDLRSKDDTINMTDLNEVAVLIQKSFYYKDLETLSKLCNYPLFINNTNGKMLEIKDAKALLALGEDKVFTEKLREAIDKADEPNLSTVGAEGASLGADSRLILESYNGIWKIIDIYQ